MSIKLNIYLLYWYFQQSQCLSIKKHAIYNIHRLTWGPMLLGPWQLPSVPMCKNATVGTISQLVHVIHCIYHHVLDFNCRPLLSKLLFNICPTLISLIEELLYRISIFTNTNVLLSLGLVFSAVELDHICTIQGII